MSMVVQHNMQAMNANRMLGVTTGQQAKATEKLSSGYKINRAADDAAGLSISEKMRKQVRGLTRATSNAQDGISAVQTAEGALTEVHSMLQRMNELANQAANGTNSESDRKSLQDEIEQLTTEIDRVAETTKFNETYLLKGDGTTKTSTVNAHDAGLKGKLTDNGDGTSTFKLDDALKVGDKITIAGKDYTIGKSKDTADYVKAGTLTADDNLAAVGDSFTINGATTTVVNKGTVADLKTAFGATGANATDEDIIVDKNGDEWKYVNADSKWVNQTDTSKTDVLKANTGTLIEEGAKIVKAGNAATSKYQGVDVVNALEKGEVSIGAGKKVKDLAAGISGGDSVTLGGVTKEVTAEEPTSFADIKDAIKKLAVDATVTIGSESYKIGVTTSGDYTTADDVIAKIKEGDTVTAGGAPYTAIGVSATDDDAITVDDAYKKIADELTKASSIGAEKAATVKNNGNGSFEITQGTNTVKNKLSVGLHVGSDADMTNKITIDLEAMDATGLGIKGINLNDESGAAATYAIDAISDAIEKVSSQRSALGAVQNRLEHTISNLDNVVENTTAAESAIRDTDMATTMVEYSKNNILAQAGQSMLAQANQSNQGVLSILG